MNFDATGELGWLLALALVIFLFVSWAGRLWRARQWDRAHRSRLETAQDGEGRSVALLEDQGFIVVDSQVTHEYPLKVDGDELAILVRCDHLVEREGRRYVAEVKTGENAPDPSLASTRRQLLEYRVAYDVDGVLLLDMNDDEIMHIEFPILDEK